MKADKHALLAILAGDVCPVCLGMKHRQSWACGGCYRPLKETVDYDLLAKRLSDTCDVHMEAAQAFLEHIKMVRT